MLRKAEAASKKVKALIIPLMAVAFTYPVISVLRSTMNVSVGFRLAVLEILYFLICILILQQAQRFLHRTKQRVRALAQKIYFSISLQLILLVLITPVVCFSLYLLFFPAYQHPSSDRRTMFFFTIIIFFIQSVILFFIEFRFYLERFRSATRNEEKLRFENMLAQYKALQNQVSPHFLFNCLNNLNALIVKNPELAKDVVLTISDTLRYIIGNQEKVLVSLKSELEFLHNYLFLQLLRFPGCMQVSFLVEEEHTALHVPPAVLQIIAENAIKHNSLSTDKKLTLSIKSLPGKRLEITNSINPFRSSSVNSSYGTGLKNIRQRYSMLSENPIHIFHDEQAFSIIIPLLDNHSHEIINH